MNKQRIIINCHPLFNSKIKAQAKKLTDKETNTIFNKSNILENCINDLIEFGIEKKENQDKKDYVRTEFKISKPTYLKLKAASMESGYSMTELIFKAFQRFNPDINFAYDHLR